MSDHWFFQGQPAQQSTKGENTHLHDHVRRLLLLLAGDGLPAADADGLDMTMPPLRLPLLCLLVRQRSEQGHHLRRKANKWKRANCSKQTTAIKLQPAKRAKCTNKIKLLQPQHTGEAPGVLAKLTRRCDNGVFSLERGVLDSRAHSFHGVNGSTADHACASLTARTGVRCSITAHNARRMTRSWRETGSCLLSVTKLSGWMTSK